MSAKTSEPASATALIARALIDGIGAGQLSGRRLVLTGLLGLEPSALFAGLMPHASSTVEVDTGDGSAQLAAIPLGRGPGTQGALIPYLVLPPGRATSDNSGDAGFAATLRTQFLEGAAEPRVLLILAQSPDETITTASDDAAELPQVQIAALLERLAGERLGAPPSPGSLLRSILADIGGRSAPAAGKDRLERVEAFLAQHGGDPDPLVGRSLWLLGEYLSDPLATPRRLADGRKWRAAIEAALDNPGRSLERHLLARNVTRDGAAKVADAAGADGMAWSSFELEDLRRESDHPAVGLDQRDPIAGARLTQLGPGGAIVAWMPAGGGTASFNLTRSLEPGEGVRLRWAGIRARTAATSGTSARIALTPAAPGDAWRFGWLELPNGSGGLGEPMPLAVTFSDSATVAFEDSLSPDPGRNAFVCGEQANLRAWTSTGRDLGLASLEPGAEEPEPDTVQQVRGTSPDGTVVGPVPVLAQTSTGGGTDPINDPGPDEEGAGPDLEGDEGTPADTDPDRAPGDPLLDPTQDPDGPADPADHLTFPHALLSKKIAGWPAEAGVNSQLELSARIGPSRARIRPRLGQLSSEPLLAAERATHAQPGWAQYRVGPSGSSTSLAHLPVPEAGWATEMARFRAARERFFSDVQAVGSAYALNPRSDHSIEYVDAYRSLLWALPRDGMHRSEYDLLVAIDTIELEGVEDVLISPMSPLSVAYHAGLAQRLATASDGTDLLAPGDLNSLTMQWVVPLLNYRGSWHESVPTERAALWRRYELIEDAAQGSHGRNSQFIANRIAFFLSVHPNLATPENRLSIACASPGDGQPVIDALRRLMATELAPTAGTGTSTYKRPLMDVVLAGAAPEIRDTLAELAAGTKNPEADRVLRTRCNIRLQDEALPDSFSHISFLFRTPGGRGTGPVELDARAPTTYCGSLATKLGRVTIPEADPVFATGVFAAEPAETSTPLQWIQYRTLELLGGSGGERLTAGGTRMVRARASGKDLDSWYDQSAWVVHLDRMIGIEAFADQQGGRSILEYEDSADPAAFGYDGITATRYVTPYLAALQRSIADVVQLTEPQGRHLMSLLESVSGRWTLQIIQRSLPKVRERVGTACAVDFLARAQGLLSGPAGDVRALVALEELVPGFPESGIPARYREARAGRGGVICDDLLLLSLSPRPGQPPLLSATVIEVKFTSLGGPDLSKAAEQIEQTNSWLENRFGKTALARDMRGPELAELLRSATTRNAAFGIGSGLDAVAERSLAELGTGSYELALGSNRGPRTRRGAILSVEAGSPAAPSLSQLNGPGGPLDLIALGRPWMEEVLRGGVPAPPQGWATLQPAQPSPDTGDAPGIADPSGVVATPSRASRLPLPAPAVPDAVPASDSEADASVARTAARLNQAFARYGLPIDGFDPALAQRGPSLIRFRTRALGKLAISEVERRARDLTREIEAPGDLLVGDEPGFITVDVPRTDRQPVLLASVLPALAVPSRPGALDFVAGVTPSGEIRTADLSRLPHLLVAGATGSGKSVFLRSLLIELIRARTPDELQLVIVDPKRLDFAPFSGVPHLRGDILHDPGDALQRLQFTLGAEIDLRQPILEQAGASSAAEFYEAGGSLEELPQLVIVIDEFADLVLGGNDRKAFSEMIQRYAQLTRAYGIFLVLATQRPSVDVITGSIKANLTARIAFALPSYRDSMTILDRAGAEGLLGDGDMLFYRSGRIERLQAPFATLADVRQATR